MGGEASAGLIVFQTQMREELMPLDCLALLRECQQTPLPLSVEGSRTMGLSCQDALVVQTACVVGQGSEDTGGPGFSFPA